MWYRLDASDRVLEVDDEWLPFAVQNEAPSLTLEAIRGRPLSAFISDPTTSQLWQHLLLQVRAGRHLDLNLRCDSADLMRLLRLRASMEPNGCVLFETNVVTITPRAPIAQPNARSLVSPLTLCSWCQRLLVPASGWMTLAEGIVQLQLFEGLSTQLISHGICPSCYGQALEESPIQTGA